MAEAADQFRGHARRASVTIVGPDNVSLAGPGPRRAGSLQAGPLSSKSSAILKEPSDLIVRLFHDDDRHRAGRRCTAPASRSDRKAALTVLAPACGLRRKPHPNVLRATLPTIRMETTKMAVFKVHFFMTVAPVCDEFFTKRGSGRTVPWASRS
jgi:hypothetical protein